MYLRTLVVVWLLDLTACGTRRNPEACDRDEQCGSGFVCNLDTNRCEMVPDGGSCTTNAQCPELTPICDTNMCRRCDLDDECASGVCHPEGLCEPEDRVLYVAPNGVSAGNCSPSAPCDLNFARMQLTATRASIRLASGRYELTTDFLITGGTGRATIVGGLSAVVQRSTPGPALQVASGATLTLRGFTMTRGVACSDAKLNIERLVFDVPTESRAWIDAAGCKTVIENSELNNSAADGIAASNLSVGGPSISLAGTKIRNSVGHGLRVAHGGGSASVTSSEISGGMQLGIAADNTALVVSRSIISRNRRGGISLMGQATYDITNNFVFRNGNDGDGDFGGMRLAPISVGSNRVRHNTIAFNDCRVDATPSYAGGLYCTNGVAPNNLVFNNYAGNATQPNAQYAGNCDTAGSMIDIGTASVHFVSPIAEPFDYHLANVSSAAMDVGTPSDVNVDFDGQPRPLGQPDVGADELYP